MASSRAIVAGAAARSRRPRNWCSSTCEYTCASQNTSSVTTVTTAIRPGPSPWVLASAMTAVATIVP